MVGPVFEHSPWIAAAAWSQRPFASVEQLHLALCEVVRTADAWQQVNLIRAHPDLVDRLASTDQLTRESRAEQASAGLDRLTADEVELFRSSNTAYRAKFGFPFVICARLNRKDAILDGFRVRLGNAPAQEVRTALAEIFKIAELRLRDLTQS